jgi:hypothetical protein
VVLELSRFAPNAFQDASALLGIRALFAGFPCCFYALAALLLLRLSLPDREPQGDPLPLRENDGVSDAPKRARRAPASARARPAR